MKRILVILLIMTTAAVNGARAQSLKNVLNTAGSIADHLRGFDITGTWVYEGVDVQFQSSNLLKKAGGAAAASRMEKKLDNQLSKLGFKEGLTIFEFNDDGTFTNTTSDRTIRGTYVLDKEAGTLRLSYLGHVPVTANIATSSKSISLLYEADAFLSVFSFVAGNSGVGALKTIGSLVNSYDGMMVGMKLVKR